MVRGASELIGLCLGLIGLIGAAATTGMPQWKVTAFIGENIIVMETRWEGLWMNCFRQASIRMQCKVYDSLLYLPADLQAARGLMCCSLALSGVGLLAALAGLRSVNCVQGNPRVKSVILVVAGVMQLLASACVFIPVSWTGHVVIRDFYNPLLIDAQRRELGEALYIGWVTGAFLFASGLVLVCRHVGPQAGSFDVYQPPFGSSKPTLTRFQPVSSTLSSVGQQPLPQGGSFARRQHAPSINSVPIAPNGSYIVNHPVPYNGGLIPSRSLVYNGNTTGPQLSSHSSNFVGSLSTPLNSIYHTQQSTPFSAGHTSNPYASYSSYGFQPVPQHPVFVGYNTSRVERKSHSGSIAGVYI